MRALVLSLVFATGTATLMRVVPAANEVAQTVVLLLIKIHALHLQLTLASRDAPELAQAALGTLDLARWMLMLTGVWTFFGLRRIFSLIEKIEERWLR